MYLTVSKASACLYAADKTHACVVYYADAPAEVRVWAIMIPHMQLALAHPPQPVNPYMRGIFAYPTPT